MLSCQISLLELFGKQFH